MEKNAEASVRPRDCLGAQDLYDEAMKEYEKSAGVSKNAEIVEQRSELLDRELAKVVEILGISKKDLEISRANRAAAMNKMTKLENEFTDEILELKSENNKWSSEMTTLRAEAIKRKSQADFHKRELAEIVKQLKSTKLEDELKKETKVSQLAKDELEELEKQRTLKIKVDQKRTNDQILEKKRIAEELKMANSRLRIRGEEREKEMEMLLKKATPSGTLESFLEEKEKREEFQRLLERLRKIRDAYSSGKPQKMAKKIVKKLISMTPGRSEMHQMANYEYEQFEGKINGYVELVEMNIEKMKETNESSELIPLPTEYPSLSDQFMIQFWAEVDQKQKKKDSEFAGDSECGICLVNMKPNHKKMQCAECKKEMHSGCTSQWLAVHRSCPYCRTKMAFPSLS